MSVRFAVLSALLLAVPSTTWAQSNFSYNLLLQTPDGQSVDFDSAPFAPLGSIIQTAAGDFMATASAGADCGRLQIGGGASASGPAAGGPKALTNPGAGFSDSITITAPGISGTGTFIARFDALGVGVTMVDDPSSSAGATSNYSINGSVGTCGSLCNYSRGGSWVSVNGDTVFSGDPVMSFETDPALFAFGIPLPVGAGLSMVAQATAPLNGTGATAGGNFAVFFSVVEVRDNAGNIVDPTILADSGCEYVPEPFAPTIGAGMLAMLAGLGRRRQAGVLSLRRTAGSKTRCCAISG